MRWVDFFARFPLLPLNLFYPSNFRRKEEEKKQLALGGATKNGRTTTTKRGVPAKGKKAPPTKRRNAKKTTKEINSENDDDDDETNDVSADGLLAQSLDGKRVSARNLEKKGKHFKKQAALARIREVRPSLFLLFLFDRFLIHC